tara:strand:+ start:10600 stop:11748 length:1149 start_codon:yes stop_codon:yes gene_type:complete
MDKRIIKRELDKLVAEASVSGEQVTKKAQKVSKKQNKAYYKDVEGKMKDYDKNLKQEDENQIDPKKTNAEGKEKEYHEDMEIMNGLEMNQYDNEPTTAFKDRAKKAIEGDATMGNDSEWANVIPSDQQGFTGPDFGKDLVKKANASKKKRNDSTGTFNQFGDDIEMVDGASKISKKKLATETMKRIKFKSPLNGVGNTLKLIPEAFRVDNKEFEMTDGNETYRMKWKGTLTEGKATVLSANSKDLVNEDFAKIKHLMGYKSENTLGTLTINERVNENKRLLENATGVGFGTQGNGFTSEGDLMGDAEEISEDCENIEGQTSPIVTNNKKPHANAEGDMVMAEEVEVMEETEEGVSHECKCGNTMNAAEYTQNKDCADCRDEI